MTDERRGTFREICAKIRTMDPATVSKEQLELLAHELEKLDVRYADERATADVVATRRVADLDELHHANRMVTIGTLTTGMAHELGTPLGVVLARAQMIVADENDLDEARKDAVEIIHQVKRMSQMCREVLDFARPKPATRDLVDVIELVRHTLALLVPEARKRGVRLVMASETPALLLGDPSKLMQVVTNLTINAVQAMPHGGTVTVDVERKHVKPAMELLEADYICVHVRDTGTGIRPADLGHIFDAFFTTKKSEGTGIGLAVSSRIAREHDGWIGVVTAEGRGSTFTLYLPPVAATA